MTYLCLQSGGFIALSQKIKGGNQAARLSPAAASCSLSSRVWVPLHVCPMKFNTAALALHHFKYRVLLQLN